MSDESEPTGDATTPADSQPSTDKESLESVRAERDKWKVLSRKREGVEKALKTAGIDLSEVRDLVDAKTRLHAFEESQKTEAQKLADQATASDKAAAAAHGELLRLKVAMRKGLTEAQAKRLIGTTEEELEADADELLASFRQEHEDEREATPTRPKEKLKSGATGTDRSDLPQLTREDLRGMSPDAIEAARVAGQLNKLQGIQ